jgi:hypothetical protein
MTKCYSCKSPDITKGRVSESGASTTHRPFFKPDGLKVLTMTLAAGVPVDAYACRSCGLVWAATDPDALRTFMDKNCEKE